MRVPLEVAVKFAAVAKQKEFSALSVLASSVGKATLCFEVEPEAFVPPPNVTSAVLLIEKNQSRDDEKFETFLKIAFQQPRKKLSKNLMAAFSKDIVNQTFAKLELDSNLRPHEAETSIYHHIYNELKDYLDWLILAWVEIQNRSIDDLHACHRDQRRIPRILTHVHL